MIAEGLYKRAAGYDYVEKEEVVTPGPRGTKKVRSKTTHKHLPPDIRAIQFWLKNRRGNVHSTDQGVRWKDSFAHTDGDGNAFALHIHHELQPDI